MRRFKIIFLLAIVFGHESYGQLNYDSLLNNIQNASTDSLRIERHLDLAFDIYYGTIDTLDYAIEIARKAQDICKKSKANKQLISCYNIEALCLNYQGKLKESISVYEKGAEVAKEGGWTIRHHQLRDNMANALFELGQKDRALKIKLEALDAFKKDKDSNAVMAAQFGVAWIYQNLGIYKEAKEGFHSCLPFAISSGTQSICEIYGNLGIVFEEEDNLDSAIHYMKLAGETSEDLLSVFLNNQIALAKIYEKKGDEPKALNTLLDVFKRYKKNSKEADFDLLNIRIADMYLKRKSYAKAIEHLNLVSKKSSIEDLNQIKEFNRVAFQAHEKSGNYTSAQKYYTEYYNALDSMNSIKIDSSFHSIEQKYQVTQKQKTIDKQSIKLRNNSLALGTMAFLPFLGIILFFNRRNKSDNLKKENKLISMYGLLEGQEEERKQIAQDLHDNIGSLMTTIKMKVLKIQEKVESPQKLDITKQLDSMINNTTQEVRRISLSLTPISLSISGLEGAISDLGQMLERENIELNTELRDLKAVSDKNIAINIYRMIQELYNNILKHAKATKVQLTTTKKDNNLIIVIQDNGLGIKKSSWNESKSIGVKSLKSRAKYLNGSIELIPDEGSHFKIQIPLS